MDDNGIGLFLLFTFIVGMFCFFTGTSCDNHAYIKDDFSVSFDIDKTKDDVKATIKYEGSQIHFDNKII